MAQFADFFKAESDGKLVPELKEVYSKIRSTYDELPAPGTKPAMIDALRQYESAHPEKLALVRAEDEFYGATHGKGLLRKYVQWIFVPAVKDASTEQTEAKRSALGQILERTVRASVSFDESLDALRQEFQGRYEKLVAEKEPKLDDLSTSLTQKMQDWAHPEARIRLNWQSDSNRVTVQDPLARVLAGEGAFDGQVTRFGHGFQRSFLIALLHELALTGGGGGPRLILACEEPELFQHPPQVRHLVSVFDKLSDANAQVVVCTHNPLFVRGEQFEEVRLVTKDLFTGHSEVRSASFDDVANLVAKATGKQPSKKAGSALKVAQALQPVMNEMFFSPVCVFVEGLEDAAYITTYLVLTDRWQEFRRLGCNVVVCDGKPSMVQPMAIASLLKIPFYAVFDADCNKCGKPDQKTMHEKSNHALLVLCGDEKAVPLPESDYQGAHVTAWKDDIGKALCADIGQEKWEQLRNNVKQERGAGEENDVYKNFTYISYLLTDAWEEKVKFPRLDDLCGRILAYASSQRKVAAATK